MRYSRIPISVRVAAAPTGNQFDALLQLGHPSERKPEPERPAPRAGVQRQDEHSVTAPPIQCEARIRDFTRGVVHLPVNRHPHDGSRIGEMNPAVRIHHPPKQEILIGGEAPQVL
jgi:hypothetical protein